MKRILAMLMAAALVISAAVLPALAEETDETVDTVTSSTVQSGKDGRNDRRQAPGQNQNGQMPQAPGQNGRGGQMPGNGQMPQMPGQNGQGGQMPGNGQMPQAPEQNQDGQTQQAPGQNGQQVRPGKGTRNMKQGNRSGKQNIFDSLLTEGVITQEIYDAITEYMKTRVPQQPESSAVPAEGTESPAMPDGTSPAEGSEPPALPDGTAPAEGSEPPALPDGTTPVEGAEPPALPDGAPAPDGAAASPEEQMLKELLDNGVITQEQYDLLLTKITVSLPGNNG